MRFYIYQDQTIKDTQVKRWQREFTDFMEQYLGITPSYTIEKYDFSHYPTYIDNDYDVRPKLSYLKQLTAQVEKEHGKWAFDHIFMFIHDKNWRSSGDLFKQLQSNKTKGIWGTNYSYKTGNLHLHYCRWDSKNPANSFGIAYHEWAHAPDALCQVETGVDITPLVNVESYDRDMTHGKAPQYSYIRHKENTEALTLMKPYVQEAYKQRMKRHIADLQHKVSLWQIIVDLKRQVSILLNKKNGVKS